MTDRFIPYGRHQIDDDDVAAVVEALRSDWLTTGPAVEGFEGAFATYVGAQHAVAVANGTAALHLCMLAAGIGPGDEVIVPALTFAASANCVRYVGATVVFADVRDDTLTVDAVQVAALISPRTKAIVAVDYAGLPADLDDLRMLCDRHGLLLVEDACHAPGAEYRGRKVGSIADLSTFSFHPVKHVTTAEGGMVTTNDPALASRVRTLRNHGITTDYRQREVAGTWEYDMVALGYNYRLSDIQCALGLSQLAKAPEWLERRRALAARYTRELAALPVRLRERLRDPVGARAALIALLLAPRDAVMLSQIAAALAAGAGAIADEAAQLAPQVHQLGPAFQLAIVDLALPAVKAATRAQQEELVLALEAVINADRRVSLHEYVMLTLVQSQLVVSPGYQVSRYKKLDEVRDPALLLIGLCAQAGCRPGPQSLEEGAAAFRAGAQALGFEGAAMPGRKMLGLEAVRAALAVLRELAPMPKALLIKGLFATVIADGSIRVIEAALMRMVGAVLDCPLPPLIADAAPGTLVP